MKPSEKIKAFVKAEEGLKLKPYKLGIKWHVGYGHLISSPIEMVPISQDKAEALFSGYH